MVRMRLSRRRTLSGGIATLICRPALAQALRITDHAGRSVPIPSTVARVLPAGPPASILLYMATPDLLIGWQRSVQDVCIFRQDYRSDGS
jgi:iron complex transport system substrate-binding protein